MIRAATRADVPRLVEMGAEFLRESSYASVIADSPAQMTALATQLVTSPAGVVLVAEQRGRLVGMLGLMCGPHFLSGEVVAGEIFWWVDPSARGLGVRLLSTGEQWAVAHGAVAMQMIAPSERIGAFYVRRGYRPIEASYLRRFDGGAGLRRCAPRSDDVSAAVSDAAL